MNHSDIRASLENEFLLKETEGNLINWIYYVLFMCSYQEMTGCTRNSLALMCRIDCVCRQGCHELKLELKKPVRKLEK